MYYRENRDQLSIEDFFLPFGRQQAGIFRYVPVLYAVELDVI